MLRGRVFYDVPGKQTEFNKLILLASNNNSKEQTLGLATKHIMSMYQEQGKEIMGHTVLSSNAAINASNSLVFAVSIYGEKHVGMLLTSLFSITKSNPKAKIMIFWQDLGKRYINILTKAFADVDFVETNFNFPKALTKRIVGKTLMWEFAANYVLNRDYKYTCLIDMDTLVIKGICGYFDNYKFDILFTYKNERLPLNTGVLLAKNSQKTLSFFEKWKNTSFSILDDDSLFKQSTSREFPYGGADQMALYEMLNYRKGKSQYKVEINGKTIGFCGVPCKELNETNSTTITDRTHIVHYKGGWQPILLEGKNFTKKRPKKSSWEMYILYLDTYINAVAYVNRKLNATFPLKSFGVKIPFYINPDNLKGNKTLYCLYSLYARLFNH